MRQQRRAVLPQSRIHIVRGNLQRGRGMLAHRRRQRRRACGRFRRQPLLRHPMHIQRIDLADRRNRGQRLGVAPGVAQQCGLQRQRANVICIRLQRVFIRSQRRVEVAFGRVNLRQSKVARRPPCRAPRRFVKLRVRIVQLALRLQRQPEVVDRLAVLGRCVAGRVALQRLAQIRLRIGKSSALDRVDAQHRIHADVAGIAPQRLLPVRVGIARRRAELLHPQARQVQLFGGLDLRWRQAGPPPAPASSPSPAGSASRQPARAHPR